MAHTTAGPVPYIIGMDIGGTNCRIGGVCSDLKLMEPVAKYNSRALFNTDEPEQILIEMIDNFIRTHPNGTPAGICIGFPGTVNKTKDTVISCPNLLAFTNRNIAGPLEEHFHIPVVAEHDVLLLLSYDMKLLGLEDADCIVSFYLGTGLGNGIYIHGRFLDGKNGVSGELGHIPLYGKTDPCPCGNTGCAELYCSGRALERLREAAFPDIPLESVFSHYDRLPRLHEFIDYMAMAFTTEINILDPDYIILAGGVIQMKDFPYDDLCRQIRHYARKPYPEQALCFKEGSNHPFAGILGAGVYMWNRL